MHETVTVSRNVNENNMTTISIPKTNSLSMLRNKAAAPGFLSEQINEYTNDQIKLMHKNNGDLKLHKKMVDMSRKHRSTGRLNKALNSEIWRMNKPKMDQSKPRIMSREPKGKVLQEIEASVDLLHKSVN